MKLVESLNQSEIILAVAERTNAKYPDAHGKCAIMAKDLVTKLKKYGIPARHVLGQFRLDEPSASKYIQTDAEDSADEYMVDHDWVTIEGKILDISARQFKRDVKEQIPNIVFVDHTSPLFLRYDELGEA